MDGEKKHMKAPGSSALAALVEHSAAVCLFLSLFVMTLLGVGNVLAASALGLALCAVGLGREEAQVDLWVLVPLIIYNVISMISSYAVYGNIILSYSATQIIFPLLYLLAATLADRESRLLRQLCAAWAGLVALHGIWQFACLALTTGARRLSGIMGNPNAMGIFLVIGWFALAGAVPEGDEPRGWTACLRHLEPAVLIALSLTLSMGSFLSLAVGMGVLVLDKRRRGGWRAALRFTCRLLGKATLCMGTGVLAYLAASRTDAPWMCLLIFIYGGALAACWPDFLQFLENHVKLPAVITAAGTLVAGAAILLRPSSIATFAERLAMMRNGLGYLFKNPVLGVGPYQWRLLNLYDNDKYFNTYHIHNVLIHVGVELGLIAMAMLAAVAIRYWHKGASPAQRGGFAAFFFHCMMDTGFFYLGITGLVLLSSGNPRQGGTTLGAGALRCTLAAFAALFIYNIAYVLGR